MLWDAMNGVGSIDARCCGRLWVSVVLDMKTDEDGDCKQTTTNNKNACNSIKYKKISVNGS